MGDRVAFDGGKSDRSDNGGRGDRPKSRKDAECRSRSTSIAILEARAATNGGQTTK